MNTASLAQLYLAIVENRLTRYIVRPANATGTTVTGAAGANTKGAYAEIVAAAGITEDTWLAGFLMVMNAVDEYHLDIATGAAAAEANLVTDLPMERQSVSAVGENILAPHYLPFPVLIAANARISARLATVGGGSDTAEVSLILMTDFGGTR